MGVALESRDVGSVLEVDPVLGADNNTIDLSLAPEIVKLKSIEQWHKKTTDPRFLTHFPTFYTMERRCVCAKRRQVGPDGSTGLVGSGTR